MTVTVRSGQRRVHNRKQQRITDPRNWPASSWISDLVPHLAYGLTTAAVFDEIYRHRP